MGPPVYVEGASHTTYERKGSSVTDTIITLNEQTLKNQLGELVRVSVEETLNKMLDAEADYNVPRELDTEFKN